MLDYLERRSYVKREFANWKTQEKIAPGVEPLTKFRPSKASFQAYPCIMDIVVKTLPRRL